MTTGFHFDATCPRCGGELLTDGFEPTIESPDRGWIDARCDFCLDVLRVTVTTTVVEPWPVDRCDPYARAAETTADADQLLTAGSVG